MRLGWSRKHNKEGSSICLNEHGGFDPSSSYGPNRGPIKVDAEECFGRTKN